MLISWLLEQIVLLLSTDKLVVLLKVYLTKHIFIILRFVRLLVRFLIILVPTLRKDFTLILLS